MLQNYIVIEHNVFWMQSKVGFFFVLWAQSKLVFSCRSSAIENKRLGSMINSILIKYIVMCSVTRHGILMIVGFVECL
jgi:hypothetical protein